MSKKHYAFAFASVFLLASNPAATEAIPRTPSPHGAELVILAPTDGDTVQSPVRVIFGLKGMGVAPAGVPAALTGHHHLLLDAKLPATNRPIASDENHLHFGGGQTQVDLDLSPGKHTLQLLLADHNHVPHDPPIASKPIEITVK